MLNLLLNDFFDTECIGLRMCIRSDRLLIFFEVDLVRFVTVIIMFLQNEVLKILLSINYLFLTKYDSVLNSWYLFVVFELLKALNWVLWCLISHYFNGNLIFLFSILNLYIAIPKLKFYFFNHLLLISNFFYWDQ